MKYYAYIAFYIDNSEGCVIAATGVSAILTAYALAAFALRAEPAYLPFAVLAGCAVLRS